MLRKFDRWLRGWSRIAIGAVAVLGVAIVGLLDFATGTELSFSVFYAGPVSLSAWYSSRRAGLTVALLSCVVWYTVGELGGVAYSHPAIPIWNALVRFGFFGIIALLVGSVRGHLRIEARLARVDPLTAAANSRELSNRLRLELARARRSGGVCSLAYVDLDDFKSVNDRFGHSEGDRLLRRIGSLLRDCVRETDLVGRLGGDEFALILADTDLEGARFLVAKVVERFSEEIIPEWGVGCSVGVVAVRSPTISAEEAIHAADSLMYEVKRTGKGRAAYTVLESGASPAVRAGDRSREAD